MKVKEFHSKDWQSKYAYILFAALVTTFLTSNILAFKAVEFEGMRFGASAALFPFSLVVGDTLSEVYGFRLTRKAIIISLLAYGFFVVMSYFTIALPPAPEWDMQPQYERFFSTTSRVFIAVSAAFLVSQILNAYVMVKIKAAMKGKNFYIRALAATVVSELAHTVVVAPILFGSFMDLHKLLNLIFTATLIKIVIEIIILPFTYIVILKLKQAEGVDFYDT